MEFKKQYTLMKDALERYQISIKDIPSWEMVSQKLTSEVLQKTLKLKEPTLLLVPPETTNTIIDAINKHPIGNQKNVFMLKLQQQNFFEIEKNESKMKWRIVIVEGIAEVETDLRINVENFTNYENTQNWIQKFQAQGLGFLNETKLYLTLIMRMLNENQFLDSNSFTVLNADIVTQDSLLACGSWFQDGIFLAYINGFESHDAGLRLRALIEII